MKYTKEYLKKCVDDAANPRQELHEVYKNRVKVMLRHAIGEYLYALNERVDENMDINEWTAQWIDKFVEDSFRGVG